MAKKPKVKKGCLIAIIILILLIVGVIFLVFKMKKLVETTMSVSYGNVEVQDLSKYVNVSGSVSSANSIKVTTDLELKVKKLNVKVGDSVRKGDVLCEMDASSLQEKYDQTLNSATKSQNAENYKMGVLQRNLNDARTSKNDALNKAQSAINKAITDRDSAYQNYNASVDRHNQMLNDIRALEQEAQTNPDVYDRLEALQAQAEALYQANEAAGAKLSLYDDAVTAAQEAYDETVKKADELIQSAQDAVDAETYTAVDDDSESALRKLQEQIDNCVITAPEDGVITQLNVNEGSYPNSNSLMTIEQTDSLVIRGKVNESDILHIEEGFSCEIKTTATEDQVIKGTLKRIERIVSSDSNASQEGYTVEVSIDDKDSNLLIGMSANVKILLDKKDNVLSVPYDALMGSENEGYFVYLLEPADNNTVKVVKKTAKKGFEGDYYTEVIDCDIKEGDIVATEGTIPLIEGSVLPDPRLLEGLNLESSEQS